MRIFITGSTGVIGRRVVPQLIAAGHTVSAMVHSPEKRSLVQQWGATAVEADLLDRASLTRALAGQEVAINLATHIPSPSWKMFVQRAWRENDVVRRDGSANLAATALETGVGRLVQESFAPVYPDSQDRWIDESTPLEPAEYNRSVADAERSAARFAEAGRAGVVLRFAAFYGPDALQLVDLVGFVRRGFAPLLGPAESFISSISHDDAAAAVIAALELPSGAYNVGDDEPLRHREYIDALADALHVAHAKLPPAWAVRFAGPVGKGLARSHRISNLKLRNTAGWAPKYRSVREGFQATVAELAGGAGATRASAA
jgi:nucleoside-diphosphate-sugar epimerase